jgi:hypothetical protein
MASPREAVASLEAAVDRLVVAAGVDAAASALRTALARVTTAEAGVVAPPTESAAHLMLDLSSCASRATCSKCAAKQGTFRHGGPKKRCKCGFRFFSTRSRAGSSAASSRRATPQPTITNKETAKQAVLQAASRVIARPRALTQPNLRKRCPYALP